MQRCEGKWDAGSSQCSKELGHNGACLFWQANSPFLFHPASCEERISVLRQRPDGHGDYVGNRQDYRCQLAKGHSGSHEIIVTSWGH